MSFLIAGAHGPGALIRATMSDINIIPAQYKIQKPYTATTSTSSENYHTLCMEY